MTIVEKWRLMMSSFADVKAAIIEKGGTVPDGKGYNRYANAVRQLYSDTYTDEYQYPEKAHIIISYVAELVVWCKAIKEQIRLAIVDGGVECGTDVPLSEYGDKIRQIVCGPLAISKEGIIAGYTGDEVIGVLRATGGKPPYTWTDGSDAWNIAALGLTLNSDGSLSGIVSADLANWQKAAKVIVTDSTGTSVEDWVYLHFFSKVVTFTVTNYLRKYDGTPQYADISCDLSGIEYAVEYQNMSTDEIEDPIEPGTYKILITVPKGYRAKFSDAHDRVYVYSS